MSPILKLVKAGVVIIGKDNLSVSRKTTSKTIL